MLDDKCCGTCKYHYHESIDGGWVCFNYESEYVADWTEHSDSCEKWERKRIMKYKVGDKVRVREDLNIDERYGLLYAIDEMIKKKTVTIAHVYDGYYGIEENVFMWTDEMLDGLVEDELTAEEAIRIQAEMCDNIRCNDCKIGKLRSELNTSKGCCYYRSKNPDKVVEVLKQFKKDNEEKEQKIEVVDLIKVMKDVRDDETCIYAYEIDINKEDINDKMRELVKEYSDEQNSKICAKYERICRVKS